MFELTANQSGRHMGSHGTLFEFKEPMWIEMDMEDEEHQFLFMAPAIVHYIRAEHFNCAS